MDSTQKAKDPAARQSIIFSAVITLMLFFMDNDTRSASQVISVSNLVWFFVYFLGFVAGHCISYYMLRWLYKGEQRAFLLHVTGIPMGFFLLLGIFFLIRNS